MPLKILIVGAGIGGLTAAIALREQGHYVTVFEQSQFASEYGAAIHIQPNANAILRRLGLFLEESGAVSLNWMTEYTSNGTVHRSMDLVEANKIWHHPWFLAHRVQLHSHLKSHALASSPAHPPITLLTSHKVTSLNSTTSTIYFSNGTFHAGDLIIGADGVHSFTRSFVQDLSSPPLIAPFPSGKSAYRFLLSRSTILANPKTAKYMQKEGELIMWFGIDRRVIVYPTSNNSLLNFVCIHPDSCSEIGGNEGWGKFGNKENLLAIYEGWDEDMLEMLKMAPSQSSDPDTNSTITLKTWHLLDMYPLPSFTKENLVLLGDAAHPYLPHQGQGAGSAIEDAAALAVVLGRDVRREEIQDRLKLYEAIRKARAHRIQEFSRVSGKEIGEGGAIVDIRKFVNHNLQHDEWDNSTQELRRWLWKRSSASESSKYLLPASFGPLPILTLPLSFTAGSKLHGDLHENHFIPNVNNAKANSVITKTIATLRFTTSRTLLQNFFPLDTDSFRFVNEGMIQKASFRFISMREGGVNVYEDGEVQPRNDGIEDRVEYEQLWFCIEGVEYIKKGSESTGEKGVRGTFIPIIFESVVRDAEMEGGGDGDGDGEGTGSHHSGGKEKGREIGMRFMSRFSRAGLHGNGEVKGKGNKSSINYSYNVDASIDGMDSKWASLVLKDLEEIFNMGRREEEEGKEEVEKEEEGEEEGLLLWRYDHNHGDSDDDNNSTMNIPCSISRKLLRGFPTIHSNTDPNINTNTNTNTNSNSNASSSSASSSASNASSDPPLGKALYFPIPKTSQSQSQSGFPLNTKLRVLERRMWSARGLEGEGDLKGEGGYGSDDDDDDDDDDDGASKISIRVLCRGLSNRGDLRRGEAGEGESGSKEGGNEKKQNEDGDGDRLRTAGGVGMEGIDRVDGMKTMKIVKETEDTEEVDAIEETQEIREIESVIERLEEVTRNCWGVVFAGVEMVVEEVVVGGGARVGGRLGRGGRRED